MLKVEILNKKKKKLYIDKLSKCNGVYKVAIEIKIWTINLELFSTYMLKFTLVFFVQEHPHWNLLSFIMVCCNDITSSFGLCVFMLNDRKIVFGCCQHRDLVIWTRIEQTAWCHKTLGRISSSINVGRRIFFWTLLLPNI